jgi:hypothetical protein
MKLSAFDMFRDYASDHGVVFYYEGEFSPNVIAAMGDAVKNRIEQDPGADKKKRKIFSTFIEMAQNVAFYAPGVEGNAKPGHGALAVGKLNDCYYIVSGNYVESKHIQRMKEKLEPLRSMTLDEIKQAYRAQLRNDEHENDTVSKGAGLGFLTLARDAAAPIEFSITETTEHGGLFAYFFLRATI